jgi:hypothetical protein
MHLGACAATFRHDSPPACPIDAAGTQSLRRSILSMSRPHPTAAATAAPPGTRSGRLVDWLALLMLLAGSIVWPH